MKRFVFGGLVAVGVLAAAGPTRADFVVVPGNLGPFGGNGNNFFPFGIDRVPLPTQRYQQVYAASEFAALGPQLITQLAFRPLSFTTDTFSTVLPSVQINLSTTAAGPDALSTTFALNVGADDTVVRSGPLPLSSANLPGPGFTRAFDIVIDLASPFLYDPSAGNLLLDVRNFGGGTTIGFDFQSAPGDSVSRVGTSTGGNVNSPAAQFADSGGLVTRFTTQPVNAIPEPASLALLGAGGLGLVGYRLRRQSQAG